jgi:hypothetical protein
MKLCLWPAKRQRKERIRAAVQHSAGIRAVRRMAMVFVEVCAVQDEGCGYDNTAIPNSGGRTMKGKDVNKRQQQRAPSHSLIRHDTTRTRTEVCKPWNAHTRPFPSTSVWTGAVFYQKTCDDESQPHDHPLRLPALVKTSRRVDVLSPTCCHDPCCDDAVVRGKDLSERLVQGLE